MDGPRTIVLGGGIGGLLAAFAVAERSSDVTLVEKDATPESCLPRKGVPQGHHVHTLLSSGAQAIEALCPGTARDLVAAGAIPIDFCADFAFFHYGVWKSRCDSGFRGTIQSRTLLEGLLWRRLRARPNIRVLSGRAAVGAVFSSDGDRVIGLELKGTASDNSGFLPCELLVDASGRGSSTPRRLAAIGCAPPEKEIVRFDLSYASCRYRLTPEAASRWRALVIYPKAPFGRRAGYIFPMEDGTNLVTLGGYCGDHPGIEPDEFLAFARTLARRELYHALTASTPLSPVHRFRIPTQRRLRYDRLRMPQGLLILGDALCVLDPLFGQGMSVAARQALALRNWMERGVSNLDLDRLQSQLMDFTRLPWMLTSSEAFRYTETTGDYSRLFPLLQWYAGKVFELSALNPSIYKAFMGMMHLIEPLHSIFRPQILGPVLLQSLARDIPRWGSVEERPVEPI